MPSCKAAFEVLQRLLSSIDLLFTVDALDLRRLTYVYPEPYTEKEFNWASDYMKKRGLKPEREVEYTDVVKG